MHLISLVSEQTLPNILFIRHFGLDAFQNFYFVTTQKMEEGGQTQAIIDSCGIPATRVCKIVVNESNVADILDHLTRRLDRNAAYTLHITGGNKLMALSTYSFCWEQLNNTPVYYMPIGKNAFHRVWPDFEEIPISVHISVKDYLQAYGVRIIEETTPEQVRSQLPRAREIMWDIIRARGKFPEYLVDEGRSTLSHPQKPFLTGGWFEIWLAGEIQGYFQLGDDHIRINVKLSKSTRPDSNEYTEYDVIYTRNNRLFIGECKVFTTDKFTKKKINPDLYKLAGVQIGLGISATSFLVTANKINNQVDRYLSDFHKLFRIRDFADFYTLKDEEKWKRFLDTL